MKKRNGKRDDGERGGERDEQETEMTKMRT